MEKKHLTAEEAKKYITLYSGETNINIEEIMENVNKVVNHLKECEDCKKLVDALYTIQVEVKSIDTEMKNLIKKDYIEEFFIQMKKANVTLEVIQNLTGEENKFRFSGVNEKGNLTFIDIQGQILELPIKNCNIKNFYKYAIGSNKYGNFLENKGKDKNFKKYEKYTISFSRTYEKETELER